MSGMIYQYIIKNGSLSGLKRINWKVGPEEVASLELNGSTLWCQVTTPPPR